MWWYLSFAGDEGWRGAVFVEGYDIMDAVQNAWAQGINPGGEVLVLQAPPDEPPPEAYRNKLLNRADLNRLDEETKK